MLFKIGESKFQASSLGLQQVLLFLLVILPALAFHPSAVSAEATTWTLSVEAQNGYVMQFPRSERYANGSTVTLSAQPRQGFRFSTWVGDVPVGSKTSNTLTLTMDRNKTLTCKFVQQEAGDFVVWWPISNSFPDRLPQPSTGYIAIASGYSPTIGIKPDGSIVAWAYGFTYSTKKIPETNTRYIAVAAGDDHSLALRSDGKIVGWGDESYCIVPGENTGFSAISVCQLNNLALKSNGTVVSWGTYLVNNLPAVLPETNSGFVSISAGSSHGLGLKANGTIVAWGNNYFGQCDIPEPNEDFIAMAAGDHSCIALKSDGSIIFWGDGYEEMSDLDSDYVAVFAGHQGEIAVKADGSFKMWVRGQQKEFPEPGKELKIIEASMNAPAHALFLKAPGRIGVTIVPSEAAETGARWRIAGIDDEWHESGAEVSITEGDYQIEFLDDVSGWAAPLPQMMTVVSGETTKTVAAYTAIQTQALNVDFLTTSGYVIRTPHKTHQLYGSTVTLWAQPRQGYLFSKWTGDVPSGSETSRPLVLAMDNNYSLTAEFSRVDGRRNQEYSIFNWEGYTLFDGEYIPYFDLGDVPQPNKGFIAISSAYETDYGLRSDGSLAAWGHNNYGQMNIPEPNINFIEFSSRHRHALALRSDGSIEAWGYNLSEQCEIPYPNRNFISISAGDEDSMGLHSDGSIGVWGEHSILKRIPEPNMGYVAISAGSMHCLALRSNGSVVAWGRSTEGQTSLPDVNTGIVGIVAGAYHNLALRSDGSIVAWGKNDWGQCDVPEPNSDFVAIAASFNYSLGVKTDGSIVSWGSDSNYAANLPESSTGFIAISCANYHGLALGYIPPPGILVVELTPNEATEAGARWRVKGIDTKWRESGTSVSLKAGDYELEFFDDLPGWQEPAARTIALVSTETQTFDCFYTPVQTWALSVGMLGGDVISSPAKTNHRDGTTVTLTAIPDTGLPFLYWRGDVPSGMKTNNPLILLMDRNRLVQGTSINTKGASGTWILR